MAETVEDAKRGLALNKSPEFLVAGEGTPTAVDLRTKIVVNHCFYTQKCRIRLFPMHGIKPPPNGKKWQSSPPLW